MPNVFNEIEHELHTSPVRRLEELIRHHNHCYWELQRPEISDYVYDLLVERLRTVDPSSSVLTEIGSRSSHSVEQAAEDKKIKHRAPMLSLDKCYSETDLTNWAKKVRGLIAVTPKMDGIAASLIYDENGTLSYAVTRGDGTVGEDITANVRTITDIPQSLAINLACEVRGEIYMRLSTFAPFAKEFANPRNLAAGAIKHKDPERCRAYQLSFAAYDFLDSINEAQNTEEEKFKMLKLLGFPLTHFKIMFVSHDELQQAYEQYTKDRAHLDYEIDGVVFKANLVSEQKRLGVTAHHPKYAIAYKFQGDSGVTTLESIEWSVSRLGVITPVACIKPITLSGATISRVSLHHAGFIRRLGLRGMPFGTSIMVSRRGGVIPKVEYVVQQATHKEGVAIIALPCHCPSCQSELVLQDDFLYCVRSETCRSAVIGQLIHFCTTLDIQGFGEKMLAQAYDSGLIRSVVDLFTLTEEKLINDESLNRIKKKAAEKLIKEIQNHRELELQTFLQALGIDELGNHVSEILQTKYQTLDTVRRLSIEDLASIPSIGVTIAQKVMGGMRRKANLIDALLQHVTIISPETEVQQGPLTGKSVVFTGKLVSYDRKTAQKRVQQLGAQTPNDVSKTLSILVVGGDGEERQSSKLTKAQKYNAEGSRIQIVNEQDFWSDVLWENLLSQPST